MLKLRKKKEICAGSVLFRGSPAPRPEHMSYLERAGISLAAPKRGEAGWAMKISHPAWGPAEILALADVPLPPRTVALLQPALTDEDSAPSTPRATACRWPPIRRGRAPFAIASGCCGICGR